MSLFIFNNSWWNQVCVFYGLLLHEWEWIMGAHNNIPFLLLWRLPGNTRTVVYNIFYNFFVLSLKLEQKIENRTLRNFFARKKFLVVSHLESGIDEWMNRQLMRSSLNLDQDMEWTNHCHFYRCIFNSVPGRVPILEAREELLSCRNICFKYYSCRNHISNDIANCHSIIVWD